MLERSDRHQSWLHLAFLFAVTLMPLSTRLLADFIEFRSALICYRVNIVALGAVLYVSCRYAATAKLVKDVVTVEIRCVIERRILIAQSFYAAAALLSFVSPSLSIVVFVMVKLYLRGCSPLPQQSVR